MTVKLQFVCENALSSHIIAWFSQGHFSHVDAILPDSGGMLLGARSDAVGGQPPGVRIRTPDYVKFERKVIMTIPATAIQEKAFYDFLHRQVGKPYDTEALWAFVVNRDWREHDSWICSEVQSAAGEISLIFPKPLYLAANKITPVGCALAFSAVGGISVDA